MEDYSAIWDEDADEDTFVETYQNLINSGMAWRLEGSVGRTAMNLIEQGLCMLGETGHRDFYGNYVPSRFEVETGTKGSPSYVNSR